MRKFIQTPGIKKKIIIGVSDFANYIQKDTLTAKTNPPPSIPLPNLIREGDIGGGLLSCVFAVNKNKTMRLKDG